MLKRNIACKLRDRINKKWLKVLAIEFPQTNGIDGAIVYLEQTKTGYDRIATNWNNPNFEIYINGEKIELKENTK